MLSEKPTNLSADQLEKWESLGPLSVEKILQVAPNFPVKLDTGVIKKFINESQEEIEGQTSKERDEANGIVRVIAADGTLREGQYQAGVPHGYVVEIQRSGGHRTSIYINGELEQPIEDEWKEGIHDEYE